MSSEAAVSAIPLQDKKSGRIFAIIFGVILLIGGGYADTGYRTGPGPHVDLQPDPVGQENHRHDHVRTGRHTGADIA